MNKNADLQLKIAKPLEPIKAILDIFDSYHLVAISEGLTAHGDEQGHAFLQSLISDIRFANIVDDIVVEWGNSLYQEIMDQFVQGAEIPDEILQQVWQNTTQSHDVWDGPIYEAFFKLIRKVNDSLPTEKKLRIILGDPPINWDKMHNKEDYMNFYQDKKMWRDVYPASLIKQEVCSKQRRALIIYGGMHLQRKNIFSNYEETAESETLVSLLEKQGEKVFTIWGATDLEKTQPDMASWKIPSLTLIRGTSLGSVDFAWYYPYLQKRFIIKNGHTIYFPTEQWRTLNMEDQFDAIMYAGSKSSITYSKVLPQTCTEDYIQMRIKRMTLSGFQQSEIDKKVKYYHKLKNRLRSD